MRTVSEVVEKSAPVVEGAELGSVFSDALDGMRAKLVSFKERACMSGEEEGVGGVVTAIVTARGSELPSWPVNDGDTTHENAVSPWSIAVDGSCRGRLLGASVS